MGTITHKVMQTLGDKKIAMKNGLDFVEDEETGKKLSLEESSVIGSYCAAQVVSHIGGRLPVNSHTDTKKILSEYKKIYSNGGQ